jgi:hypothetical protein
MMGDDQAMMEDNLGVMQDDLESMKMTWKSWKMTRNAKIVPNWKSPLKASKSSRMTWK